jgi:hypothetical protein
VSVSGGFNGDRLRWLSKIELREDDGAEVREQWVSTNRVDYKLSEDLRFLGGLNYSDTSDSVDDNQNARFVESSVGFGYRPTTNDRLNLLGKYTYLYDLASAGQQAAIGVDQKSNILSIEGIYDLSKRVSLGGKLAQRKGELREGRGFGNWFESTASLAAMRARYHLPRKWDALLEYRWLSVDEAETDRHGLLLGIDRQIRDGIRLGIGYNFTDFSDDLTYLDYDKSGWFLNIVGQH